jgi:5-(carboxyamino)imidazole ribonucleotide synthase
VVEFRIAKSSEEMRRAVAHLGFPVVAKTTTTGYDGKGQHVLQREDDLDQLCAGLSGQHEFVVERFIPVYREVSVIAVREGDGTVVTFPVVENEHRDNILHVSRIPARVSSAVKEEALKLARSIVTHFAMTGVLCVEMFVTQNGKVLVNELAPRPHNSGHFSLDACSMSQFEALVRSVCNIPMQEPRLLSPCAMVNLLGKHLERIDLVKVQEIRGAKVHLYGKKKLEQKRKMGHVTITGASSEEVEVNVQMIEEMIGEGKNTIGRKKGNTAREPSRVEE